MSSEEISTISKTIYEPICLAFTFFETDFYTGTSERGELVDLPVNKDLLLGIPEYPATGLKGTLRGYFELSDKSGKGSNDDIERVFGSEHEVGSLIPLDMKLIFFPAPDDDGSIAYFTSIDVLNEFYISLSKLDEECDETKSLMEKLRGKGGIEDGEALGTKGFEELSILDGLYTFKSKEDDDVKNFAGSIAKLIFSNNLPEYNYLRDILSKNLYILNHRDFKNLVRSGLGIATRIRINAERKVVETGALFTQEVVPRFSIFYTMFFASLRDDNAKESLEKILKEINNGGRGLLMFFGGNESVGKGLGRILIRCKKSLEVG